MAHCEHSPDDETRALLALMLTPGLGPTLVGRCTEAFGSARHTLAETAARWAGVRGISANKSGELKWRGRTRGLWACMTTGTPRF